MNHASPHGEPTQSDTSHRLRELSPALMPGAYASRIDCAIEGLGAAQHDHRYLESRLIAWSSAYCHGLCSWTSGIRTDRCPELIAGRLVPTMGVLP